MTASELYYKYGEKVEIPQGATEAFMMTEYHFVKALKEYTDQAIADMCRKQREICAIHYQQEEYKAVINEEMVLPKIDFTNVILNAPMPKGDK